MARTGQDRPYPDQGLARALPTPGSPPTSVSEPGTTPPPSTRLSSAPVAPASGMRQCAVYPPRRTSLSRCGPARAPAICAPRPTPLPERAVPARAWHLLVGGRTGEWRNLRLPEAGLAQRRARLWRARSYAAGGRARCMVSATQPPKRGRVAGGAWPTRLRPRCAPPAAARAAATPPPPPPDPELAAIASFSSLAARTALSLASLLLRRTRAGGPLLLQCGSAWTLKERGLTGCHS